MALEDSTNASNVLSEFATIATEPTDSNVPEFKISELFPDIAIVPELSLVVFNKVLLTEPLIAIVDVADNDALVNVLFEAPATEFIAADETESFARVLVKIPLFAAPLASASIIIESSVSFTLPATNTVPAML